MNAPIIPKSAPVNQLRVPMPATGKPSSSSSSTNPRSHGSSLSLSLPGGSQPSSGHKRASSSVVQTKQLLVDQFFDPGSSKENSVHLESLKLNNHHNHSHSSATNDDDRIGALARKLKGFEFLMVNADDMEADINKQNHEIVREINQLEKYVKGDLKHSIEINDFQYQENEKKFNNTMKDIRDLKYKISQYALQIEQNTNKLNGDKRLRKFNGGLSRIDSTSSLETKKEMDKFEKMLQRLTEHEETLKKSNDDLKLIKSRLKELNLKLLKYEKLQIKKYQNQKFCKKMFLITLVFIIFLIYRNQ